MQADRRNAVLLATTARQARRAALMATAGCGVGAPAPVRDPPASSAAGTQSLASSVPAAGNRRRDGSGSPDDYAADCPGRLSPIVRGFPSRLYVPTRACFSDPLGSGRAWPAAR